MDKFVLKSDFRPVVEQIGAVEKLADGINSGKNAQVLLGVTGSGKTFTLANIIEKINRPVLVISHNKTLAAQLYCEFKEFFPQNAVEYFVSYYDYYQPEAYIPQTDVYIEKDASINDSLDRLRLSSTTSLMSRRDVIIIASVSCIYNLGSPKEYQEYLLYLETGQQIDRDEVLMKLIDIQYERNDFEFTRGKIRVRGDTVEVYPAYRQDAIRIEFFGDEIEKIAQIDPITGTETQKCDKVAIYPAKHFIISQENIDKSLDIIKAELVQQLKALRKEGKLLEAQRLESRTNFDMEMLKEIGYCNGIENYSRSLSQRPPGSRPFCLLDYFPDDFVTLIDESHVTLPQIRGMYEGDRSRKETLVKHGFRLPSCLDNRPLKYQEFNKIIGQKIYISATPSPYEIKDSHGEVAEQIIRPTGIVDPPIEIRNTEGQIEDLATEVKKRAKKNERVLVTTLTKRMAEDLTAYFQERGLRVKYVHSDVKTIDRSKILKELRQKKFDCLVGVNLLREGLDLPEVSLVAILDADKQGFLRSKTSLMQVSGRAARNVNGLVIMYADSISEAMADTIKECDRRRKVQIAYNEKNGITPSSIEKAIRDGGIDDLAQEDVGEVIFGVAGQEEEEYALASYIAELEREMELSARNLQFEKAAAIRDKIKEMKDVSGRP
ncbi:MAG: excinuclease ABC subunit B [Omnitrophica WOR_2 bacterium GWF2_38_59]|nr:MAG: excinuclease ABC subunit B [Omnitrophica WOR_2 bacterium GWA2_37_7]OGX25179.1 MAG: excinuclease ABC subunit B [Omnitrophica WOR_2 bacterium GWF2_38_59]OGX50630.1 MAG: excinuclease ABC subunit B [Omnitrophica WOR_2 bacterium RIFOXYA2_FULL_38_17]OGX53278.1 MAG: excinuclease ABC subunit B [Omnitrophica WOR_2 bacterium RIFOXYA12_FULL_38_10]OGX56189.1 MAG: excinuclease ABC subunit B [Omnitrophica WOR_2 bacterium RIFOXYC2_FULL_38_12]OGX57310.1 MAG: excinuclease ABC subunit B [Omnitrophica WO